MRRRREKKQSKMPDDYYSIKDLQNLRIFKSSFIDGQEERVVKMHIPSWLLIYEHFWHDGGDFEGSTIIPLVEDTDMSYYFFSNQDIETNTLDNNVSVKKGLEINFDRRRIWAKIRFDEERGRWLIKRFRNSHQKFIIIDNEIFSTPNDFIELNNKTEFIIGGTKFNLIKLHSI